MGSVGSVEYRLGDGGCSTDWVLELKKTTYRCYEVHPRLSWYPESHTLGRTIEPLHRSNLFQLLGEHHATALVSFPDEDLRSEQIAFIHPDTSNGLVTEINRVSQLFRVRGGGDIHCSAAPTSVDKTRSPTFGRRWTPSSQTPGGRADLPDKAL